MGPTKRRVALVAVGLSALLCCAAAQAQPKQDPVAYAACDKAPCQVPDKITAPANGSAIETLPVPSATGATVAVKPYEPKPDPEADKFFQHVQTVLSGLPSTRARIHACIGATIGLLVIPRYGTTPQINEEDAPLATLFMQMCLQVVAGLLHRQPAASDAAGGGCHQAVLSVGVQVTRAGRGYRVATTGPVRTVRRASGVKVVCKRLRNGLQISVAPAKRGQKLARALGPSMQIGFVNPSSGSVPLQTTVVFR